MSDFQPLVSPVLSKAMDGVGPPSEWSWYDGLSVGDGLRVVFLREIVAARDTCPDVREAATTALTEMRRLAEERVRAQPMISTGDFNIAGAVETFRRLPLPLTPPHG